MFSSCICYEVFTVHELMLPLNTDFIQDPSKGTERRSRWEKQTDPRITAWYLPPTRRKVKIVCCIIVIIMCDIIIWTYWLWKGQTGKYLYKSLRAKYLPVRPDLTQSWSISIFSYNPCIFFASWSICLFELAILCYSSIVTYSCSIESMRLFCIK